MDKPASVSVVIVNWNRKELLAECLSGLKQQEGISCSIIVVDNGSTDGSAAYVNMHHPDIDLIALPENTGFAVANNIAIERIETEYTALLNNDAVPDPNWLHHLVAALDIYPEAGFAASRMLFYDAPDRIDRTGDAYTLAGTGWLRGRGKDAGCYHQREWVFGACAGAAIYRTRMLRDLGGFDEDFFLLYEDVDLSFRAQLKGYQCLYVPEAVVYHKASASIVNDSPTSVYFSHRNLEWTYIKNMPARLILLTLLPHMIYNLASAIFFVLQGRGIEYSKAKLDTVCGLKKILKKRKQIQKQRITTDRYIFSLFEKEYLFPRLIRRFRKNAG